MEKSGEIVWLRFANADNRFNATVGKLYKFWVEHGSVPQFPEIGDIVKVFDYNDGRSLYNSLCRIECRMAFNNYREANESCKDLRVGLKKVKVNTVKKTPFLKNISPVFSNYEPTHICFDYKNIDFAKFWKEYDNYVQPHNIAISKEQAKEARLLLERDAYNTGFILGTEGNGYAFRMEAPVSAYGTIENNNININDKGENAMNKIFKNFKFGEVTGSDVRYSVNGIAFKSVEGDYVTFDKDGGFTNVNDFVINIPLFQMPVAKRDIKAGDVIRHNDQWVIVESLGCAGIYVVKPWVKERVNIVAEKSIFGFDFYTKLINPFEGFGGTANSDNPFGNMLPFLMMREGGDKSNMLMAMMIQNGQFDMSNPMMMYAMLSGEGKDNDMLMAMMMMQNMGKGCQCGGGCKCKEGVEDSVDENRKFWSTYADDMNISCTVDLASMNIDDKTECTKED